MDNTERGPRVNGRSIQKVLMAKARGGTTLCSRGRPGVRAGTLETSCEAYGLRAHPTVERQEAGDGGGTQATVCKGAGLTQPLALAWALGTGPSISLTELHSPLGPAS